MNSIRPHLRHKLVWILVVEVLVLLGQRIHNVQVLVFCKQRVWLLGIRLRNLSNALVDHHVTLVIDDLVKFLGRNSQEVANLVWKTLEVPNVNHRNHQVDVAHPLTTNFLFRDFNTATVTHDALVADALVFAAVALVILDRTKNALAKQAIAFRLVCAVVDGLGLQHFSVRCFENALWRRQRDGDLVEVAAQLLGVVLLEHLLRNQSSETVKPRPRNSCMRTLNDSGMPGVGITSPFTMAS